MRVGRFVGEQGVVRALSRDIGQPTSFTHPQLLAKDEGDLCDSVGVCVCLDMHVVYHVCIVF